MGVLLQCIQMARARKGNRMTVQQIQDLLAAIDPDVHHYDCATDGSNFTVWMEYQRTIFYADDGSAELSWKFEIDRYTKDEYDPIVERIEQALMACENVTLKPRTVQYDQITGYIRHIFDCEAV